MTTESSLFAYNPAFFDDSHADSLLFSLNSTSSHVGSRTCPKGLNPAAAIAKIKLELAAE